MLKGLSTSPRLFVKQIILEDGASTGLNQNGYVDLYTDAFKNSQNKSISKILKCTLEFDIKFKYPSYLQNKLKEKSIGYINFQKKIKSLLLKSTLRGFVYKNSSSYKTFLTSKAEDQESIVNQILDSPVALASKSPFSTDSTLIKVNPDLIDNLMSYTYYDEGVPYVSIPQTCTFFYEQTKEEDQNPSFLAAVFCLRTSDGGPDIPKTIIPNTLSGEIIFNNGKITTQTGYFIISDTFSYKGEEKTLFETSVYTDVKDKDPITGIPLKATKATPLVEQININYGSPGDVWVGPIHWHKYIKTGEPASGTYRPMAGAKHVANSPHPYLEYVTAPNNKIIDFRSIGAIEKLFKYNSNFFDKLLADQALLTSVHLTGEKKKNTLDELVQNKGIISDINYSIRPTIRTLTNGANIEKNTIQFLFAIDKLRLIKETTALPGLMDKLINSNTGFIDHFINLLEINHFEIIRINKTTNKSVSLITGNNDKFFSDSNAKNILNQDISKGYRLVNKTNIIEKNMSTGINFYEFTDGNIDVGTQNNSKYTYEIKLKFRDPLIILLTERLRQVRLIIKDLDELLFKSTLKIKDNNLQKFVNVYSSFKNEFNTQFIKESLDPPANPQLPLDFSFTKKEIPQSVAAAFSDDISGLLYFLVTLNDYNELEPVKEFMSVVTAQIFFTHTAFNYIMNSLKLSSTSPTLIERVRKLCSVMEDRFVKYLSLYSTQNITKKDTGFSTADYYKSTEVKTAGDQIINFDYVFKKHIDLSKTKNTMNWIGLSKQFDPSSGLQVIGRNEYKKMVTINKKGILTDTGNNQVSADGLFSYAFIPYTNCVVDFYNREFDLGEKFSPSIIQYQAIRKKLMDRITGKDNNILVPELLSFFGIKFALPFQTIAETHPTENNQHGIGYEFPDNLGQPFDPIKAITNQSPILVFSKAFGSIKDPDYEWQGMSFEDYPLVLAESIINLLTTDNQTKNKDISSLRKEYSNLAPKLAPLEGQPILGENGIFSNKTVPYEINLFSTTNITTANESEPPFSESYVTYGLLNQLFAQDGELNYDNYPLMMAFLGLFGKVYYFNGFGGGVVTENLTPSSYHNRSLVKSMNWCPLRLRVLDNLTTGKQLLCKVELFLGEENASLLDQRVINLFKDFYTNNQYFYIQGTESIAGTEVFSGQFGLKVLKDLISANVDSKPGTMINTINQNIDLPTAIATEINTMSSNNTFFLKNLTNTTKVTIKQNNEDAQVHLGSSIIENTKNVLHSSVNLDVATSPSQPQPNNMTIDAGKMLTKIASKEMKKKQT